MKLIAVSDLHGYLPKKPYPDGDCLVIAGDVLPDLRPIRLQAEWAMVELLPWLKEKSHQYRNIILTWGNHDFVDSYGERVAGGLHAALNSYDDGPPSSFVYIAHSPQTIDLGRHKFFVSPYCLELPGWAYTKNENELAQDWAQMQLGTECIISHGPPLDMCDKIEGQMSFHAGSKTLKEAINKLQPKVVICGHIHEAYGMHTKYHKDNPIPTKVYNVAQLDVQYKYYHRPVEIELPQVQGTNATPFINVK